MDQGCGQKKDLSWIECEWSSRCCRSREKDRSEKVRMFQFPIHLVGSWPSEVKLGFMRVQINKHAFDNQEHTDHLIIGNSYNDHWHFTAGKCMIGLEKTFDFVNSVYMTKNSKCRKHHCHVVMQPKFGRAGVIFDSRATVSNPFFDWRVVIRWPTSTTMGKIHPGLLGETVNIVER